MTRAGALKHILQRLWQQQIFGISMRTMKDGNNNMRSLCLLIGTTQSASISGSQENDGYRFDLDIE
jgi:hypothetical protein